MTYELLKSCKLCLRQFHPNSNKQVNCMACRPTARSLVQKKANAKYYDKTRDAKLEYDGKYNRSTKGKASEKLRAAVRSGKIQRQPCETCGKPSAEGHHEDYSKPLEVRWLCRRHHAQHHLYEDWQIELMNAGYKGNFSLESLIEACGEGFKTLIRCGCDSCKWNCYGDKIQPEGSDTDGFWPFTGSSPIQAVKSLYIALNKK